MALALATLLATTFGAAERGGADCDTSAAAVVCNYKELTLVPDIANAGIEHL